MFVRVSGVNTIYFIMFYHQMEANSEVKIDMKQINKARSSAYINIRHTTHISISQTFYFLCITFNICEYSFFLIKKHYE